MISEAELRRKASAWGVDAMVVDLDYALGWAIYALYAAKDQANRLCFKGGTCLRKCHFGAYRFSEDLDFTAVARVHPDQILRWAARASEWSRDHDGPGFEAADTRIETSEDEYGRETYQARIYYRGPLRWSGRPRAIRLDVTRDEVMLSAPESRRLIHPYSDAESLADTGIPCYSLAEILAEKLRAIGGQRRFAISRDLYDIHHIVNAGVTVDQVAPMLAKKFAARGVDPAGLSLQRLVGRRNEFQEDWTRRLSYLIQGESGLSFEAAWETMAHVIQQVEAWRST